LRLDRSIKNGSAFGDFNPRGGVANAVIIILLTRFLEELPGGEFLVYVWSTSRLLIQAMTNKNLPISSGYISYYARFMGITKLDALDRKLLYELDSNSRQSMSALARKVKQGRDRVSYRLDRLLREGVIKQCTVTINPYRLGYTLFKTYLKVNKQKARYDALLTLLRTHPRIYWIADCDGRWDLIFATFAQSPFEFFEIQNKILSECNDIVLSFTNLTLVNVWMYRKNYLVPRGEESFLIGGPPSQYSLERFEWEILRLLSRDSRMSIADMARALDSNESTVRYRLEQLELSGLIAGYRIELDLSKLGMMFFKAQLYLSEYGQADLEAIRAYCARHPNITYFIEQIGDAPAELEIEVDGYDEFTKIINGLRLAFPRTLRNVETVLIHRSRFKWVPYGEISSPAASATAKG